MGAVDINHLSSSAWHGIVSRALHEQYHPRVLILLRDMARLVGTVGNLAPVVDGALALIVLELRMRRST